LAILLSLLAVTLPVGSRAGATPATAIVVYDHGLTNKPLTWTKQGHFIPGNKTSVFTQDNPWVYAYFTATLANASVTWLWIDPDGQVYLNETNQIQCDVSPCSFVYSFRLGYTGAAKKFGLWTLTLQAGGIDLYSDYFSVIQVITQDDYWNFEVTQSAQPRVHGDLTVTIHPSNGTWSSYLVNLPFATNVTAYELPSKRTLDVVANKTGHVVVNLGGARSDGYRFVLSFDLLYGSYGLSEGVFVFNWQESGWGTFDDGYHSIPSSFNITLPPGVTFLDITGVDAMTLNPTVAESSRPVVEFRTTLPPGQRFGWTALYRNSTYANSNPSSGRSANPVVGGLNLILAQPIPFLPLTLGSLSLWAAVMSVFLLTGSELLAPAYGRTGVLINRRRLRIAALILAGIFLAAIVYAIIILQSIPAR
jgi:hypothetical protein